MSACVVKLCLLNFLVAVPDRSKFHPDEARYFGRCGQGRGVGSEVREEAHKRLGSDDPSALAIVMEDFLSNQQYKTVQNKIKGIRLMPLDRRIVPDGKIEKFNKFNTIRAYWRTKGAFKTVPVKKWGEIFQEISSL